MCIAHVTFITKDFNLIVLFMYFMYIRIALT